MWYIFSMTVTKDDEHMGIHNACDATMPPTVVRTKRRFYGGGGFIGQCGSEDFDVQRAVNIVDYVVVALFRSGHTAMTKMPLPLLRLSVWLRTR